MVLDLLFIITVVINIVLATGVYLHDRQRKKNKLFAAFVAFLTLWMASNFLENEPGLITMRNVEMFLRLDFAFAVFIFYAWFRFCATFAKSRFEELSSRLGRPLLLFLCVGVAGLSLFTPWIITNVSFYDDVVHFENGVLWPWYALVVIVLALSGLIFLFKERKNALAEKMLVRRRQLNFILFGFFLSIGNAIGINLLQGIYPMGIDVSRIGIYGMVALVIAMGYVVANLRLFELRLVIARAIAFLFVSGFAAVLYASLMFFAVVWIFHLVIDPVFMAGGVIIAAMAALTFEQVRTRIEKATDAFFFKGQYSVDVLLFKLTKIMASTIDFNTMARQIIVALMEDMRLSGAAISFLDDHRITDSQFVGFSGPAPAFDRLERLVFHQFTNKRVVASELPEGGLKESLESMGVEAVIPLSIKGKEIGVLVLGLKASGESFLAKDFIFLDIFVPHAAIALQNARSIKELIKLDEVKSEFISTVSHQFRTPLSTVRWDLELLLDGTFGALPEKMEGAVSDIYHAVVSFNEGLNDLLTVLEIEQRKSIVHYEDADSVAVIDDALIASKQAIKEKNIVIRRAFSFTDIVRVDRKKMERVMEILLANAVRHSPHGGTITISTEKGSGDKQDCFVVSVANEGPAVAPEDRSMIFQKFFRGKDAQILSPNGFGLGLFISKNYAELHGGKMWLGGSSGRGATFFFSLPTGEKTLASPAMQTADEKVDMLL